MVISVDFINEEMEKSKSDNLPRKRAKWHSLSSVILVTTYCLIFFSGAMYFSAINGQIIKVVAREDKAHHDKIARIMATNAESLISEIDQPSDQFVGPIDYFGYLNEIGDKLTEVFSSESGEMIILNANGELFYSSNHRIIDSSYFKENGFDTWSHNHHAQSDSQLANFNAEIGEQKLTIAPIGKSNFYAGLIFNNQSVMKKAARLEFSLIITLLVTLGVLLVLFMLLIRLIMIPLRVLIEGVQRIGQGELGTRVRVDSSTEIGVLGKAFNSMAEDLADKYQEIEDYSDRLEMMNEDSRHTNKALARRNKELALINSISYENGKNFTFQENLDIVVKKIEKDYSTVFVGVFLKDERHSTWFCSKTTCDSKTGCKIKSDFDDYLNKISDDYRLFIVSAKKFETCFILKDKPEQLLLMPFMLNGETKAIIVIGGPKIGWMSTRDLSFLRSMIRHAGIILHNAYMYELSVKRSFILEKINSIGQSILGELDLQKLISRVLRELKTLLHVNRAMLVYTDEQNKAYNNFALDEEWDIKSFDKLDQDVWIQQVLETNQTLLVQDYEKTEDWVWDAYGVEYKSFLGIPLPNHERPGLLALYATKGRFFSSEDVRFINTFANYISSALANARLFSEINEREKTRTEQLEVAKKFQSDRIPYNFEQGKLEFECSLEPAMELAGDFFDVFTLGAKSVGVVIGDVATKGIPASLMTFSILSMFRNAAKSLTPPNKVMALVNQGLRTQIKEQSWFATAFYARIHTDDLVMTYSKAGHVLPILYQESTGECIALDVDGIPLGILQDGMFETGQIKLSEGDRLILYTDGVTEIRVNKTELFGLDRLIDVISRNGTKSINELKDAIFNEIELLGDSRFNRDDILVAVLGIKTNPWINRTINYEESNEIIEEIMERISHRSVSKNMIYAIRLSLSETLANAHKHGNRGDSSLRIHISYLITDESFNMVVGDEGSGFDHEALPDPTVEANLLLPHGRGVFLMRSMMDDVEFNDVGNVIKVKKRFMFEDVTKEAEAEAEAVVSV